MPRLVNLTRSTVVVYDAAGERVLFELPTSVPSADARLTVKRVGNGVRDAAFAGAVPVVRHVYELTSDLPAEELGTIYVVSWAVLQAVEEAAIEKGTAGRYDLVAPDTARDSVVKDGRGKVLGVRQFRVL